MKRLTLSERLSRRTRKTKTCWLWTGSIGTHGYGQLSSGVQRNKPILVHRAAWIISKGRIPPSKWVLHKCDNRVCVRPSHLFLGSAFDNTHDMVLKGRGARGEQHGNSKLKETQVLEIRGLASQEVSRRMIAKKFRVSSSQVREIIKRRHWKHI